MIIFLLACVMHKTNLTGIIDHVGSESCAVELSTGELVIINSRICKHSKEGDIILFYGRKE